MEITIKHEGNIMTNNSKSSVVDTPKVTMNNLPSLGMDIVNTDWFQQSINNDKLKSCPSKVWKLSLFKSIDNKTGKYSVELVREEVKLLSMLELRPPKKQGGNNSDDYSQQMLDVKQQIVTLIESDSDNDNNFTSKSGRKFKPYTYFREVVRVNGKWDMLTTIKTGTTYTNHKGESVVK